MSSTEVELYFNECTLCVECIGEPVDKKDTNYSDAARFVGYGIIGISVLTLIVLVLATIFK